MKDGPFRVPIGSGEAREVTAIAYAAKAPIATLVLGHGAGAPQRHPYMVGTAERLRARHVSVVTFDFEYAERGRKLPDPKDALEACFTAAFVATTSRAAGDGPVFSGGKSMGGRIATQCTASGAIAPKGLVLLGYPLHPPAKPEQRRDRHLPDVHVPMLFVQGTRDAFGTKDEIAPLVAKLAKTAPGTRFYEVVGADHSHAVLKRDGVPQETVYEQIADTIAGWIGETIRA